MSVPSPLLPMWMSSHLLSIPDAGTSPAPLSSRTRLLSLTVFHATPKLHKPGILQSGRASRCQQTTRDMFSARPLDFLVNLIFVIMMTTQDSWSHTVCECTDTFFSNFTEPNILYKIVS